MYVDTAIVYLGSQMYSNYIKHVWWAAIMWVSYKMVRQHSCQKLSSVVYIFQSYCQNKKVSYFMTHNVKMKVVIIVSQLSLLQSVYSLLNTGLLTNYKTIFVVLFDCSS